MALDSLTKAFVSNHLNDDVRRLALSKAPDGVDLSLALQQIDGRQRAKTKLPALASNPDILFPVHLSVEQCSSENTAQYKRQILERLLGQSLKKYTLVDLTGGFGIDFIHLSPLFNKAVYVERNAELCQLATHNFNTLNLTNARIINAEAETFLSKEAETIPGIAPLVFFMDPARRDNAGKRTFAISDCTPDVISLIPTIRNLTAKSPQSLSKTPSLLFLKLSPMLDWHKAVADIKEAGMEVQEIHIVSVRNECKELLIIASFSESQLRLFCKNDESLIEITEATKSPEKGNTISSMPNEIKSPAILFIPNASLMKAGCWDFLINKYNISKADANSHIFFSNQTIEKFPGQQFNILRVFSLNKKEVRSSLANISRANISIRNFPLSPEDLRKRLKLKDGGNHHIFATTIKGEHKLLLCSPI